MKRKGVLLWIMTGVILIAGGCDKEIENVVTEIPVQEEKPVEIIPEDTAPIEIHTDTKEHTVHAEDGTVLLSSVLRYPMIALSEAPEAEEKIEQIFASVKEEDERLLEEYESWATEQYRHEQEFEEGLLSEYAMEREYAVTDQRDALLSIRGFMYSYTGGAHPGTVIRTWNLDLETGEEKKLMDLAEEPERLRVFLNEWIQKELERREIEEGISLTEGLYPDYPELIVQSLEDPVWYVQEGDLWIVFNEYEIAPYAAGIIEVEIPLDELQEYWNETGRRLLTEKK